MHLTKIWTIVFGMLMMGLVHSSSAKCQSMFSLEQDRAEVPKAKPVVKKTSFVFKASEAYLAGGTAFDMTTTVRGLDHSTTAYTSSGTPLTRYYVKETGWARYLSSTDPSTVVLSNVALNCGVDWLGRRLYARGGHWRTIAVGALLVKGTLNIISASNNIRNDGQIDNQVRIATGYRGLVVWSH
jgi:hypothetical protein